MDYFRTFPSYVNYDDMTYESSYLAQHELKSKEEVLQFAAEGLDSEEMLVWFRNKYPIAFINAGDIVITALDKSANFAKVFTGADGAKSSVESKYKLTCSIYPIEFLNSSMEKLQSIDAIATRDFCGKLNMLQFKGFFSATVGGDATKFMHCLEFGSFAGAQEIDRLTWRSSTFGPDARILYTTTELWQVLTFKQALPDALQIPGACISKASAAEYASEATMNRYFQFAPGSHSIDKMQQQSRAYHVCVLHRAPNLVSFEVQDMMSFAI